MKATVYFENEKQGYAAMTANSIEYDEVDGEQIIFVYQDKQLRGVFRLDAITSVHLTGEDASGK